MTLLNRLPPMFATIVRLCATVSVTGCDMRIERTTAEATITTRQMRQIVSELAKRAPDLERIESSCDSIGLRISSSGVHVSSTYADDHASCHTSSYALPDGSVLRIEPVPSAELTKASSLTIELREPAPERSPKVCCVCPGSLSMSIFGMLVMARSMISCLDATTSPVERCRKKASPVSRDLIVVTSACSDDTRMSAPETPLTTPSGPVTGAMIESR